MKKRIIFIYVLFGLHLYFIADCVSNTMNTDSIRKASFTLPEIPSSLKTPRERAVYLSVHYWDHYNFADTTLISKKEITEQAFVDFLEVLQFVDKKCSGKSVSILMDAASVNQRALLKFAMLSEKYLYNQESSYQDEELYLLCLNKVILSQSLGPIYKVRSLRQLKMVLKNRPGSIATDFVYTLATGKKGRLSSIKSDYTILFFNNPDCIACSKLKKEMAESPVIKILDKQPSLYGYPMVLTILGVYPDTDIPSWKMAVYPKRIINSYDEEQEINNKELYDLKTLPTLYLLDRNKRVVMKNVSFNKIEEFFARLCKESEKRK